MYNSLLFNHTYLQAPSHVIDPVLQINRDRLALDYFEGFVLTALGALSATPTPAVVDVVRSTPVFDVANASGGGHQTVNILVPGFYKVTFELNVTGAHDVDVTYEGSVVGSAIGSGGNRIRITAAINTAANITPASPGSLQFVVNTQTQNLTGAENGIIIVERIGSLQAL